MILRNNKSQNSSSLILKENNRNKGHWFNRLFQTFKTMKVLVERTATKFLCAL